MKTKKIFICGFIVLASALIVLSCDVPLALGHMLDIRGPVVDFTSPAPRKAVVDPFDITGTVFDESPVERMLIKTSRNNLEFAKQWQYTRNAGWQVSENYGLNWSAYPGAQWNGNEKAAFWVLPVELSIGGISPEDGEYMFTVQAWDSSGFSDDNSFKTLVLIYDKDPPIVEVYNPFLYDKYLYDGSDFLGDLFTLADAGTWKEPALLGKFLTQEFQLQWQIEDQHDIWSIELYFYEHTVNVDGIPETEPPQDYIYYYHENLPPPELDPTKNIKPNGSVTVPDLGGSPGQYNGGALTRTLDDKTIIQVVSVCYDAAANVNQEKVLGYFVFWPQAAQPWITYTEGMEEPSVYIDSNETEAFFNQNAFMIYPGRNIRATAFQTQGVSKVEFTLHNFTYSTETTLWTIGNPMDLSYMQNREGGGNIEYANSEKTKVVARNPPRPNGSYSTIFPWDFMPLARSANYVVRAQAYDSNGKPSDEVYEAAFRVQDITFPDFPKLPDPPAGEPLYMHINNANNTITISGVVADATEVESLYMVWINPESKNFAAMSQLSYFRDADYKGWTDAIAAAAGGNTSWPMEETEYDEFHPNKVWKVNVDPNSRREDPDTQRIWYNYSQTINLSTLNIGINAQPLISQVFLMRAMNPDKKSTIITYAPQGDTISPTLIIDRVSIAGGTRPASYTPGEYAQVPRFEGTETITVEGRWTEDSTEYLNNQLYFYNNMEFTINNIPITAAGTSTNVVITPTNVNDTATAGTFILTAQVGGETSGNVLRTTNLRDTLVVNAKASDIGGNPVEAGASWLIESDTLRFLRISSENEDKAYKNTNQIEIFLEFNKPVRLKPNRSQNPVLVLNTAGGVPARAYYNEGQSSESTRHFFTYTVAAGQNTPNGVNLNVSGISIVGGVPGDSGHNPNNNTQLAANATDWQNANYPFTFVHRNIANAEEEIRLTTAAAHINSDTGNGVLVNVTGQTNQVWARVVPVTTTSTDSDYKFTFIGGKRITIDNTAPTLSSIEVTPTGRHKQGVDIYITATFSKPVRVELNSYDAPGTIITRPQLTLGYTSGGTTTTIGQTINTPADVRVNNNKITFRYTVGTEDTGTNQLQVIGFSGNILDVPGTNIATIATTTLTGVYLDNTNPAAPSVTVHGANTNSGNTPSTTNQQNPVPATLYYDYGSIQIAAVETGAQHFGRIEYTLNSNATTPTWSSVTTATHNITLANRGSYSVQTRQVDQAGNISSVSTAVNFTWDPGNLVTRISSSVPNQTYTHNSGVTIPITIYFRKSIDISAVTGITLNALTSGGAQITLTTPTPAIPTGGLNNVNSLTFNYNITNGDRMPNTTDWLDVVSLGTITATDRASPSTAVTTSTFITLPAAGSALRLNGNKEIRVATGSLNNPVPTFIADASGGTGYNNEANANFHGIRSDDGSYWTTLEIVFNQNISKGTGDIKIEQIDTGYRLPVVLTETQYNRFRGIQGFSGYYTKGTNGYIIPTTGTPNSSNSRSDTSTKYVLNYNYNPNGKGVAAVFTGDNPPTDDFFDDFREAEGITLSVNSQAVTIVNNNTLRVRLSGSNAPQVPGATYNVSYPAGLVNDDLGNSSVERTNTPVILRGVAKPFIRIKKTQDTITQLAGNADGNATTPRLTATQPRFAYVRMDGRTPGSAITYWTSETPYTATASNWNLTGTQPSTTNAPRPTLTNTGTTYPPPNSGNDTYGIRIGADNYNGLKYWITARAAHNGVDSSYSDEMAYRTAITFRLENLVVTGTTAHAFMQQGDQIWVRGGDSISSSSIPGFPLTWEDDWDSLKGTPTALNPTPGRRAGIRLMTMTANGTASMGTATGANNNSTWQFLTWEINATAYVDIILGHDRQDTVQEFNFYRSADVDEVWQYGPRYWTLLRGGWAAQKALYPVYAGEIRYLNTNANLSSWGNMNFSAAFNQRPSGGTNGVAGWSATVPNPNQP